MNAIRRLTGIAAAALAWFASPDAVAGEFLVLDSTVGSPTLGHLFDVDAATGSLTDRGLVTGLLAADLSDINRAPDGTLYGVAPGGPLSGFLVYAIDEQTMSATPLGNVPNTGGSNLAIAVHPLTNHVWVAAEAGLTFSFYEVDLVTPSVTFRGSIAGSAKWGLAFDATGDLYHLFQPNGQGQDLELIRIDQVDASLSQSLGGMPGLGFAFYATGVHLASDVGSGSIHIASNSMGQILAIDPTGPTASLVSTMIGAPSILSIAENTCWSGLVVQYGSGCAGSGGFVPSLTWSGCPQSGAAVAVNLSEALGGSTLLLMFGTAPGTTSVGSCTLLLNPILAVATAPLGGTGPGTGSLSIPGFVPVGAVGSTPHLQAWILDPALGIGAVASNGLRVSVGP